MRTRDLATVTWLCHELGYPADIAISVVSVSANTRGRGTETLLMKAAEDRAKAKGYKKVGLRSATQRQDAHRLYGGWDYVRTRNLTRF